MTVYFIANMKHGTDGSFRYKLKIEIPNMAKLTISEILHQCYEFASGTYDNDEVKVCSVELTAIMFGY